MNWVDVIPNGTNRNTLSFIQVAFVRRNGSGLCLDYSSLPVEFLHVLFAVTPVASNSQKLVVRVTLRRSAASRSGYIAKTVATPRFRFDMAISLLQILVVVCPIKVSEEIV